MKKYLLFVVLLFNFSVVFASSDVVFPMKNQEVKPYPGTVSINLNGTDGKPMHNGVYYKLTCLINNSNNEAVMLQYSVNPNRYCNGMGGCGGQTLNGQATNSMLNLKPGINTFVINELMIVGYNPNTKIIFSNYDNTLPVIIQDCKAVLQ